MKPAKSHKVEWAVERPYWLKLTKQVTKPALKKVASSACFIGSSPARKVYKLALN